MTAEEWVAALQQRHRAALSSAEFLKAIRALSVRYVERRGSLGARSPLDSAGKRAAFAAYYALLHFFTTTEIIRALSAPSCAPSSAPSCAPSTAPSSAPSFIYDLGCGTGVASAAWALSQPTRPELVGVDVHPWALTETAWNWRQLGLRGRVRRENLLAVCQRLHDRRPRRFDSTGVVLGWSVNEVPEEQRVRLLPLLLESRQGRRRRPRHRAAGARGDAVVGAMGIGVPDRRRRVARVALRSRAAGRAARRRRGCGVWSRRADGEKSLAGENSQNPEARGQKPEARPRVSQKSVPAEPSIARRISGSGSGPSSMNASWNACRLYCAPVRAL